jgi:hypothetical protein
MVTTGGNSNGLGEAQCYRKAMRVEDMGKFALLAADCIP